MNHLAAIELRGVGIRFRVPRHTRYGRVPRLFADRKGVAWAIRGIDLDVAAGEKLGVVGANGSGKTTLLRAMAHIYDADEGRVVTSGRVGPILSMGAGLKPQLTGWQNVDLSCALLGLQRSRVVELYEPISRLAGLGDALDVEVRAYSSGMRARLAFAITALADPDILILDEVVSVADHPFRDTTQRFLDDFRGRGGAIVQASHELESLAETSDRFIRLHRGGIVDSGEPGDVLERYLADHTPERAS